MSGPSAPPPPPPPAGWYPADRPGFERWWDGFRWSDHVRPSTPPVPAAPAGPAAGHAAGRPTETIQLERITWAGVAWGGHGGSALSTGFGALFVLISLPPLLFALMEDELWRALFMVAIALVLLVGAAALFINAHFCRVIEQRQRAAWPPRR